MTDNNFPPLNTNQLPEEINSCQRKSKSFYLQKHLSVIGLQTLHSFRESFPYFDFTMIYCSSDPTNYPLFRPQVLGKKYDKLHSA